MARQNGWTAPSSKRMPPPGRRTVAEAASKQPMELTTAVSAVARERVSVLIPLFVFSTIIPNAVLLGPIRLSPSLLLLLVCFVPMLVLWLTRRMGPIIAPDLLILGSAIWASLALVFHYGAAGLESAGRTVLEVFGAYLFGRWVIRGPQSIRAMIRWYLVALILLLPFAIFEALTGTHLYLNLLSMVSPTHSPLEEGTRLGLYRVQVAFEHSIHYGLFASSLFALLCIMLLRPVGKVLGVVTISASTFLSLSTGPFVSYMIQAGLLLWSWVLDTPWRWKMLVALIIVSFVVVDLISNRTPFHVFASYLTFNPETAYARINIWNFGSAEVARHPFFGIGYGDWERPEWMSSSVDMFWLRYAMQHGILASVLLGAGCLMLLVRAGLKQHLTHEAVRIRRGLIICLVGVFCAAWSADLWRIVLTWTMFLTGSLVWIAIANAPTAPDGSSGTPGVLGASIAPKANGRLEGDVPARPRSLL